MMQMSMMQMWGGGQGSAPMVGQTMKPVHTLAKGRQSLLCTDSGRKTKVAKYGVLELDMGRWGIGTKLQKTI